MAGPCSPSPTGAHFPEPSSPPGFDAFDSFLYDPCPDFDPVKEWLVDPDQFLMPEVEGNGPTYPDGSDDPKTVEGFGESCSNPDSGSRTMIESRLKEEFLKTSIDEKMGKVSLAEDCGHHHHHGEDACTGVAEASADAGGVTDVGGVNDGNGVSSWGSSVAGGGNGAREVCTVSDSIKVAQESDEESSEAETEPSEDDSEPSGGDSSSSSSSSSEEEEEEEDDGDDNDDNSKDRSKGKGIAQAEEVEEGEIVASDEDEEEDIRGPIRTKHEVEILANRVIVNGSVKHNPLNEGSILWITETRSPLGPVDEIFGPVKNPYYVVRYNSGQELPVGISVGTAVSFVMEFANCILNAKQLHKKGYDASGEHDEELMDEVEFSDDEKEGEYKRSLQQAKRDCNVRPHGNQEFVSDTKRTNYKNATVQEDMPAPAPHASVAMSQLLPGVPGSLQTTPGASNLGQSNVSSFQAGNPSMSAPAVIPSAVQADSGFSDLSRQSLQQQPNAVSAFGFPPHQQPNAASTHGFPLQQQPNAIWTHGFPPQQQPNAIWADGFPSQQQPNASLGNAFPPQQQPNASWSNAFPPHQQPNASWGNAFPPQQQPTAYWGLGYALQQQPNAIWNHGFPPQQQSMGMQGGFLGNVSPVQQPGDNTYNHLHQNQAFNSFPNGMLYQQLISSLAALANTALLGGPVNPSACTMSLGSGAEGNFSQVTFGCDNMQEQGAPSCGNVQNLEQPPSAAAQGGIRPPMQFNPGRSFFRGRKPHHRGGRRSFGRGGRPQRG
ncbi:H/ACA ribonucleoprotein complex non-core subunit NAF1 [Cocos nucifera]|uniref:H/ACA ribonucleoprotein complex non-core subunit NAF1 n=1 Tax=Cocos nucifera TaxID=13894 RepID=A0A8K0IBZ5_COCNU|nr:H/ACA ribonucleoprotein complex non-core subunit NAF1 [Cocos nucifera]